ncbi:enoyl-CoA hydratase-related protein (plasmid) [Sphingobium sp. JS3065]|uniref:enoyl-CoA hydratase-related protein n=1 Tax=Sphingobium sp. JS3065 TaxID=2970925 RepID=UPI0022643882|nr:enoyl-CoA hydratase-related protein [Sphingobium sp. JS3065]UZW58277.1 enoyl-CoA hydratase-related protein [Sphingobium sp. JS3065]
MSGFNFLKTEETSAGVFSVVMDRPPANGVNRDMYIELYELFSNPDQLGEVRVIVLSGAGKHFCAGNDLDEFQTMTPSNGTERMWRVREAFYAIQDCSVPVIGAVQGAALGTGLAIAASCDFVVAASEARFGLPELTVGVMGGARHLARIAPQPLVRRMFLTGEHIKAVDFAQAGGSIVVDASGALLEAANRYAQRIASFSPTASRLGKQILNKIEWMDIYSGYEFEQRYTVKMSGHADSKEALLAFRESRAPQYRPLGDWRL